MFDKNTLSQIRNNNLSDIIEALRQNNGLSLAQLVEQGSSGLTTVKKCVQQALEYGMIYEAGEADSTGGRKAMKYALCPDYQYFLILIVDNGNLSTTLYDFKFEKVYAQDIPFTMGNFLECVYTSVAFAYEKYNLGTVCLSMPCVVKDGVIIDWYYNPSLVGLNIKEEIEKRCKVNVIIQNNMNLTVLGESRTRNNVQNIVTAQFSHNGIGVGEMANGHMLEGSFGFAGEIGYMNIIRKDISENVYHGKLLRNVIICINPEIVVLYQMKNPKRLNKIINEATKGLPDYAIPKFEITDNYIDAITAGFKTLIDKYAMFVKRN